MVNVIIFKVKGATNFVCTLDNAHMIERLIKKCYGENNVSFVTRFSFHFVYNFVKENNRHRGVFKTDLTYCNQAYNENIFNEVYNNNFKCNREIYTENANNILKIIKSVNSYAIFSTKDYFPLILGDKAIIEALSSVEYDDLKAVSMGYAQIALIERGINPEIYLNSSGSIVIPDGVSLDNFMYKPIKRRKVLMVTKKDIGLLSRMNHILLGVQ